MKTVNAFFPTSCAVQYPLSSAGPFVTVPIARKRWRSALTCILLALTLLIASFDMQRAHAATAPASKIAADLQQVINAATTPKNTFVKSITWVPVPNQSLVTAGVVSGTLLLGTNSSIAKSGAFTPTASLSSWLQAGSGVILSESVILSEGVILSESGQTGVVSTNDSSLLGEP